MPRTLTHRIERETKVMADGTPIVVILDGGVLGLRLKGQRHTIHLSLLELYQKHQIEAQANYKPEPDLTATGLTLADVSKATLEVLDSTATPPNIQELRVALKRLGMDIPRPALAQILTVLADAEAVEYVNPFRYKRKTASDRRATTR